MQKVRVHLREHEEMRRASRDRALRETKAGATDRRHRLGQERPVRRMDEWTAGEYRRDTPDEACLSAVRVHDIRCACQLDDAPHRAQIRPRRDCATKCWDLDDSDVAVQP